MPSLGEMCFQVSSVPPARFNTALGCLMMESSLRFAHDSPAFLATSKPVKILDMQEKCGISWDSSHVSSHLCSVPDWILLWHSV